MGLICSVLGHKWDCYKCQRCGKKREKEQHEWEGDKCARCGTLKKDFELAVRIAATLDKMGMTYNDYVRIGSFGVDGYGADREIQIIREEYGQAGIDQLLEAIHAEGEDYSQFISFVKDKWDFSEKSGSVNP